MEPCWEKWLWGQSQAKRDKILFASVRRLIEMGEVGFQIDDIVDRNGNEVPDDGTFREYLYWESTRDDMRIKADDTFPTKP